MPRDLLMETDARISECGLYRYNLWRRWGSGDICTFIMLNPSTADAHDDDPTIRRCISFAKREECEAIMVMNLFAFRATKPADMEAAEDPIGPENDVQLRDWLRSADRHGWPIIAAWGASKFAEKRGRAVASMCLMQCLGTTQSGSPRHPLYVKGDQPLIPYS